MQRNLIFIAIWIFPGFMLCATVKADGINLLTTNPGFESDMLMFSDNGSNPGLPNGTLNTPEFNAMFITTSDVHSGSKAFHAKMDYNSTTDPNREFFRFFYEEVITSVVGNDYFVGCWVKSHHLVDCTESTFGGSGPGAGAWIMIGCELALQNPGYSVYPDNPDGGWSVPAGWPGPGKINPGMTPPPNTDWFPTKSGVGNQILSDLINGPEAGWYYVESGSGSQPTFHGDGRDMRVLPFIQGTNKTGGADVWMDDLYLGITPQYVNAAQDWIYFQ